MSTTVVGGRYQITHQLISMSMIETRSWLLILEVLLSFFPLELFSGHRFTNLNIIPP